MSQYTQEQVAEITQAYQAGSSVEDLAAKTGKSVKSVIAKLSAEGVYVAKTKAKAAAQVTSKADLIAKIAEAAGVDAVKLESLGKATKDTLQVLVDALKFEQE